MKVEPPDYTEPLSLLMNLMYDRGGRKVSDYAVYRFVQERDTGRLLMQDTTNRDYRGYLVPDSWEVGRQFVAFFPVGFIWSLVPSNSLATVVGAEWLKLKAGEFQTWKVSQRERDLGHYHTDAERSNFWWYDPAVVFPVKAQTDYACGAQFFLTLATFETAHAAPPPEQHRK